MTTTYISPSPLRAAAQLTHLRTAILLNPTLPPDAKEWHIACLERSFADAQYAHTLSPASRLIWVLVTLPETVVRAVADLPNVLRYGVYHGDYGLLEEAEGEVEGGARGGHGQRAIEGNGDGDVEGEGQGRFLGT